MRPKFTLGVEEEFQTLDPVTRDLRSHIHTEIMAKGKTEGAGETGTPSIGSGGGKKYLQ